MMKSALITGGLLLLSGCIPAPLGRYYQPVYPDPAATYAGDLCYGKAGAPAVLTVPLPDGVSFTVRATARLADDPTRPRQLDLSVKVPAGVRFRFVAPQLTVEPADAPGTSSPPPSAPLMMDVQATLRLPARDRIAPADMAPTPLRTPQGQALYTDYRSHTGWTPSWGEGFVPQAITMTLPTVLRPGQADLRVEVQAQARPRRERLIGEQKGHTSLMYATAESDAETAERHRRCLAEGRPASACQAIITFDTGGFRITRDELLWRGRWYVADVEQGSPFRADLTLEVNTPSPWQLSDNQIRVRDLSTQTEKRHTFEHLNLSLSYRVPLDSPVYLPTERALGPKGVVLSTRRSIGSQEAERYRVTLPEVEINGRRLTLPPIEFVRHSLDFGLLPFNC